MMTPELFRLDKRLALITGSSGGIGFALARGLGQCGATIILNGRNPDKLAAAATALRAEGLNVYTRTFDAADAQAVQTAVDDIEAHIGAIDILVNNAGMQRRAPLEDFTTAHWHDPAPWAPSGALCQNHRAGNNAGQSHKCRRRRREPAAVADPYCRE